VSVLFHPTLQVVVTWEGGWGSVDVVLFHLVQLLSSLQQGQNYLSFNDLGLPSQNSKAFS